jgi:Transposase DDE domain group 1
VPTARRSPASRRSTGSSTRRPGEPTRYHKIGHDAGLIERLFVDLFLDAHRLAPEEVVLDLDATDDPLHGAQEGRFFHGCYCYLPLDVVCGDHLLAAQLRRSDCDASAGAVEEVARLVRQIRARWPHVRIVLRADSGFAREALMAPPIAARSAPLETEPQGGWCETNRVDYVLGLARNPRLVRAIAAEPDLARAAAEETGPVSSADIPPGDRPRPMAARCFKDFRCQTLDTWSRERRVVGPSRAPARARCADRIGRSPMAEQLVAGDGATSANPRFVVTSLAAAAWPPKPLYEELYCARGEMENRIKECQLDQPRQRRGSIPARADVQRHRRGADRTSTGTMRANQLRLWFASMAYVLLAALRRIGLATTWLARATAGTIRLKLLKLGALVRVSARRVTVQITSSHPWQREWTVAHANLAAAAG